jgi:hypothetical protein
MKSLTDQEYLELIQKMVDQQYDNAIDEYDIEKMEWIPSEPEIKKKIHRANTAGMIDLTNVKSTKIKEELLKCTNLKVGPFKVRIKRYNGAPSQQGIQMTVDMEVWEERTQTPSGHPCRIDYPMVFYKDTRFKGRPWLKYFNQGNFGSNVPIDTAVEILRWMQAIKKLTAFL